MILTRKAPPQCGGAFSTSRFIERTTGCSNAPLLPLKDLPALAVDVAFANARHGIAVGDAGLVLETLNGGVTWSDTRESSLTLSTVTFRDEESALAGGRSGSLFLGTP
jgi:photosystem II stability/assembly factor-like uncharacterized protein